ncbi:MAG: SpoIID/LytB domain-containing protein [Lachnospiraceae bacterium]|nr:SpoIID/LytB domain-containing protein [Lachnospiraceae bacterium]
MRKNKKAGYRFPWIFLLFLTVCVLLGQTRTAEAKEFSVDTRNDVRVGLKSKYAQKSKITLYHTTVGIGFCNGWEYETLLTLTDEEGVTVTPERGDFFEIQDFRGTAETAEELAESLREAGAVAYAVLFSADNAGVYLPVAENGETAEEARIICENAVAQCKVALEDGEQSSAYLIRITAGEQILFADGAEGKYPQFVALEENEDGIFAVDLGERSYRGRIEIGRYGGRSTVTAVNVVPLEEYLYGVVPCEMPASWPLEALKGQAVCARSFALVKAGYHAETDIKRGYRMEDTVQSQVYGGITFEHARSNAAVDATEGETLCYENRTVAGYYFAASGGHTENAEDVWNFALPYLQSVPDIYETNPSKRPWSVTLDSTELARLLASGGENVGTVQKVTQEITTASGRVYSLKVKGSLSSISLNTAALRTVLQLASTKFKVVNHDSVPDLVTVQGKDTTTEITIHDSYVISGNGTVQKADGLTDQYVVLSADNLTNFPAEAPEEGEYLFAGMGAGHGVGMSQSGARGMAERGFTYKEILEHYYTGISVR